MAVERFDDSELLDEVNFKGPEAGVVGAELKRQRSPGNEGFLLEIAHAVGQPRINIKRQRAMLQGVDDPKIQRHGTIYNFSIKLFS